MKLLRASILNFENLDILGDSIGHPSKSYCGMHLLRASVFNFVHLDIFRTQSDIRVNIYCRLNFLGASVFYLERLNIFRDSVGHPSKKLLSFKLSTSFRFKFWASRYITGLNRTSVYKVIVIWICYELPFSIWSI